MLGTEIKHFLGGLDASDQTASNTLTLEYKRHLVDSVGLGYDSKLDQSARRG